MERHDDKYRAKETWCVGVRWDLCPKQDLVEVVEFLLAHKHVIYYFLFRKHGGGGGCLGGLNQIKQPRVADFFFAYPLTFEGSRV